MREFKVGDKVILDPNKVTAYDLKQNGSSGKRGEVYTIKTLGRIDCILEGRNWHMKEWLTLHPSKHVIGGELI